MKSWCSKNVKESEFDRNVHNMHFIPLNVLHWNVHSSTGSNRNSSIQAAAAFTYIARCELQLFKVISSSS